MGFEIQYTYHERLEGGEYNKGETKTMKKRVGDPFEDVCLDKCAGAILAQLARRDIWVTDVEVFEVTKKKVTFRESKGGVILKNKKYQMDSTAGIVSQEITEVQPAHLQPQPPQGIFSAEPQQQGIIPNPANGGHPHNRGVLKPIKWVIYQPSYKPEDDYQRQKLKMLRLTIDKKYPVFAEQLQSTGVGMAYKMLDDANREILVSDEYFIPAETQLVMDRELRFSESPASRDGGNLSYGGVREDNMPKLR